MLTDSNIFVYHWFQKDEETDEGDLQTVIYMFGLDVNNKNICVKVEDFTPYCYIELPNNVTWNDKNKTRVMNKIEELMGEHNINAIKFVRKKKLFYNHKVLKDNKFYDTLFPYLYVSFNNSKMTKQIEWKLKDKSLFVLGVGPIKCKVHENNASPILQLTCNRGINTAGWINFKGKKVKKQESYCDYEYIVSTKDLKNIELDILPRPLIMGFDLEVNSHILGVFPNANNLDDKVFQISCVFSRQGDTENKEGYLLTLGDPIQEEVGDDVIIRRFPCEGDMLIGFRDLILERNPNIITGYNIFNFDIPYLLARCKEPTGYTIRQFDQQGFLKGVHSPEKRISWSSSAYKDQEFYYLDAEGRLYVDLLPIVQRDYKLENYKLSTVAKTFMKDDKDDLDAEGIFKSYRMGMAAWEEERNKKRGKDYNQNIIDQGRKQLSICGKYCMKDSVLCNDLFEKLQTWVYLTEMAKVCQVPPVTLYTQGQQIKVFSQVYKMCLSNNFVVEKDGYETKETDRFEGAMVFEPIPGAYNNVVPFDFTSLYPTTIIAYNICYSTLVRDRDNIPDDRCHIIEWETHTGCEHDTNKRKSKLAKEKIFCQDTDMNGVPYRFKFLKSPQGILPRLLKDLLDTRKKTKGDMKVVKGKIKDETDPEKKKQLEVMLDVLDKRQLAFKVSANSVYGSLGTRKGYLPFLPGAMCTTAMGRYNIKLAAKHLQEEYNGTLIYGDTDSNYIHFPPFDNKPAHELWDHCLEVEKSINRIFPEPMKLLFEEAIYRRFFILSKKRYMALKIDRDGDQKEGIEKRGVLLQRRDNAEIIRHIYGSVVMRIFEDKNREDIEGVMNYLIDELNNMCSYKYCTRDYVITKSIGDTPNYNIRSLPMDEKKKLKRLKDLKIKHPCVCPIPCPDNCFRKCKACSEYVLKALPAHIQLAERIRSRGKHVQVGSRMEYIICRPDLPSGKLFDKNEDPEYQQQFSEYIKIDPLYYINLMINPFDEALEVGYGIQKFVKQQHKLRLQKVKIMQQIKDLNESIIN